MADPWQVKLLDRSIKDWNDWRKANPNAKVDLSGANLADHRLSGANLSSANLSNTTLTGTHLSNANLSHANLSYADLRGITTAALS
jgi:uncharacterized protein YjbI with pentapeptide repeats